MTPLLTFLIAFAHRVLSGWQSMYLYREGRSTIAQTIRFTFVLAVCIFISMTMTGPTWAVVIVSFACAIPIILKEISFSYEYTPKWLDIHLWESAVTGSFWLYLAITGHDLIALCCSVYPALIIHKGLINIGNGLKFFDERTDNATGKTYSIPVLKIKVPRSSLGFRIIFAFLSIIILVACTMLGVTFSI